MVSQQEQQGQVLAHGLDDSFVMFPSDGTPLPCAVGTIFFNFETGEVTLPLNSEGDQIRDLYNGRPAPTKPIRSVLIWADDDVRYALDGGYGTAYHQGSGSYLATPINRSNFRVIIDRPCNFYAWFSTRPDPVTASPYGSFQERLASETLTKTAAAGTEDSFAALTFAPLFDTKEITPSDTGAGQAFIHANAFAHKLFMVEAGDNPIDVNIQLRQRTSGNWVDDPSTGESYRVDANQPRIFVVERAAHFIRMRTRVAGMIAAAQTSDVVVQYRASHTFGGSA